MIAVDHPIQVENLHLGGPLQESLYFQMRLVRRVEETLLDLFGGNELFGTTHTSLGQEANAAAIMNAIDRSRDMVWSNHRCHGHFICYCGNVDGLVAEIMGRTTGVCGGRGGSQHLHWRNFASSGVQGGIIPAALGAAYAEKARGAISVVFLGDGTMGQGIVYECLNLASLWSLPVLFVVEDNEIAQTTPSTLAVAGSITQRAAAFGIDSAYYDGTDAEELHRMAVGIVDSVRQLQRPYWFHIKTVRLGPHSKGDDTRTEEEMRAARAKDPLTLMAARLADTTELDARCEAILAQALESSRKAPFACA